MNTLNKDPAKGKKNKTSIDKVKSLYDICEERSNLNIVCDWDEVIMSHEPYALWWTLEKEKFGWVWDDFFKKFWSDKNCPIYYNPYGAGLTTRKGRKTKKQDYLTSVDPKNVSVDTELIKKQKETKNSPEFYHKSQFLTIAEDLMKLLKEGRVDRLVFLTAYDKRKFPEGDRRKREMYRAVFGEYTNCFMDMVGFDDDAKGADKAGWLKKDEKGFDIVIDDNPNICKSMVDLPHAELKWKTKQKKNLKVCSPYYPAIEKQHDPAVILLKNEVLNWCNELEGLRMKYLQNLREDEYERRMDFRKEYDDSTDKSGIKDFKSCCEFRDKQVIRSLETKINAPCENCKGECCAEMIRWKFAFWLKQYQRQVEECKDCWLFFKIFKTQLYGTPIEKLLLNVVGMTANFPNLLRQFRNEKQKA